jgi:hypothetical protein
MVREIVLLGIGALFGLGATMSALAAPAYFPNAPPWVWHWLFWGGIALMALMICDAACLAVWRLRVLTVILANAGILMLASAAIAELQPQQAKSAREPNAIYQAGVLVGNVFGVRRSPNDATTFEFVEITNANKLNSGEEFEYDGYILKMSSAETKVGLNVMRPDAGMIYTRVIAKIIRTK